MRHVGQKLGFEATELLQLDQRLTVGGDLAVEALPPQEQVEEDLHLAAQDVGVHRLEEEVEGTAVVPPADVFVALVHGRDEDDGDLTGGGVLAGVSRHLVAVHVRHLHVQQHHREVALEQLLQRFIARVGADQLAVQARQLGFQRQEVGVDVVDQQDMGFTGGHRHWR
jgi:hypothetical protein